MDCPRAVIFDYDDTLTESFQAPEENMLRRLTLLCERMPIAIDTGASFRRLERDVAARLDTVSENLYLFPDNGATGYSYKNSTWRKEYSDLLAEDEIQRIRDGLHEYLREHKDDPDLAAALKELEDHVVSRNHVFERESMVAFTPMGVNASLAVKRAWDPVGEKRFEIASALKEKLPDFDILLGGTTTLDITKKGMNKAYGVRWLSEKLNIPPQEMLFIGDSLFEGGNDAVVIDTGIRTQAVENPADTEKIIDELLENCA